jgi:hypothetical protein
MKNLLIALACIGLTIAIMLFVCRPADDSRVVTYYHTDTLVIRDTVREVIPSPRITIIKTDTLFVAVSDTVLIPVYLPIQQKTFSTDIYTAVIQGYNPELISLEVYPTTKIINNTETIVSVKRQRFGVGVHVGYGLSGGRLAPYVGIGVQYNLFGF